MKNAFFPVLDLKYIKQPDNLIGWATFLPFAIYSTDPRINRWNFKSWQSWKTQFFWVGHFDFFLLHPHENQPGFHMRYCLFLQHVMFVQNLGKDFIPTNMHMNLKFFGQNSSKLTTVWRWSPRLKKFLLLLPLLIKWVKIVSEGAFITFGHLCQKYKKKCRCLLLMVS